MMTMNRFAPGVPGDYRGVALVLDLLALGTDISAETIVGAHAVGGALAAKNPAGAGPGWLVGQGEFATKTLLFAGNILASFASGASIVADMKEGTTRAYGAVSISRGGVGVDVHATMSSTTYTSFATAVLGWPAPVTEISLGLQIAAVVNDFGLLPSWQLSPAGSFTFP
jgi:hypothetical protein